MAKTKTTSRKTKRAPRPRSAPTEYASTLDALAGALGRSVSRVYVWRGRGAPIERTSRGYNVTKLRAWLAKHLHTLDGENNPDKRRLLKAQADEKEAKAKLAKLRHQIETGKLVPLEEIRERDIARITAVKRELLALPRSIAAHVSGLEPREIKALLTRRMRELVNLYSSF